MEPMDKKLEQLEFQQKLLMNMIEKRKYPFFELIIKKGLSESEVVSIYQLCDDLSLQYEEQKELGFVYFCSLLTTFAGMLTTKLTVNETICAMYNQDLYKPLMTKLKELTENKAID